MRRIGAPRAAVALACAAVLAGAVLSLSAGCDSGDSGGPAAPPSEPLATVEPGFSVGYAEGRLDAPVGVSLAGYAARYGGTIGLVLSSFTGGTPEPPEGDLRPHPFAFLLPPSIGVHTAPKVKGFALAVRRPAEVAGTSDEIEDLVIVHVDIVASHFSITEEVVRLVRERTGIDLANALFLSASHTHSSAGRFADNLLFQSFGGLDSFSPEIFTRLTRSIADTVVRALRDREPARMGVGIRHGFDPLDLVYHDRRHGNDEQDLVNNADNTAADPVTGELAVDGRPDGWIKDRRLVVFRFERTDGTPKAALVHFPVHGTVLTEQNLLLSTDTTGMIEAKTQELIDVPVAHLQGATGDVQPAEVNLGFGGMERAAKSAAPVIAGVFRSIQTTGAPARLRSAVTTFRSDRELLGYDTVGPPYDQFDAPFGAVGCGVFGDLAALPTLPAGAPSAQAFSPTPFWCVTRPLTIPDPFWRKLTSEAIAPLLIDDFTIDTYTEDLVRDIVVGVNPEGGPYTKPSFLFATKAGFLRIDGVPVTSEGSDTPALRDLAMFLPPGEPTTPWAFETRRKLALGLGLSFEDTFVVGYTNDHAGYILNREDWVTGGGGEIQINPWGPLWGEQLRRVGLALGGQVSRDERVPPGPIIEPSDPVPYIPPPPTRSPRIAIVAEPRSTARFGTVEARFLGGDPIVDTPHAVVERDDGSGEFQPVVEPGGRPLDETGYETVLVYDFDENDPANPHAWSFRWQLTERETPGRYRFRIGGRNHDGQPARKSFPYFSGEPYELVSEPFEVSTAAVAITDVTLASDEIRVTMRYPEVADDPDPDVADAFRDVPTRPARVHAVAELTPVDGASPARKLEGELDAEGAGRLAEPLTAGAVYDVQVEVSDAFSNAGTQRVRSVRVGAPSP